MSRFYYPPDRLDTPTTVHPTAGCVLAVPKAFRATHGALVKCKVGAIGIPLVGVGFYVCEPDGFVDIPHGVQDEAVKGIAPQLLTEEEHAALAERGKKPAEKPANPTK